MHDIRKELRSFVHRFVIFALLLLHLFVRYFNVHIYTLHISSIASPLKVRNFFIIWFIGLWSLCTLCVCACLWIFPTKAPLTPAQWYQREFYLLHLSWGLQSPFDFEHFQQEKISLKWQKNVSIYRIMTTLFHFFPISKSRYSIHKTVFLINPLISSGSIQQALYLSKA